MPEKNKLTIDQVALLAGVSRSVVSRVLNNHPRVSDAARERVLTVIETYNYRPSSVARSLATDRTFEICIVAPRRKDDALANGFWPLLSTGISEACLRRGYMVSSMLLSADTAEEVGDRILNERVFDGYLLVTQEVSQLVVPRLAARKPPMVLIGRDPGFPDLSSIDVDNFDGARQATAHLIGLGHRRIGAILGNEQIQETADRRSGFLQALVDAGIPAQEDLIAYGRYAEQSGFEIMSRWIAQGGPPPAVFCASDAIATGALLALYEAGIPVPDGVAVVGFDDVPTSRYTTPPLTTVRQPIYQKGMQAAELLIRQIEQRASGGHHRRLPARLVIRGSCGAAAYQEAGASYGAVRLDD